MVNLPASAVRVAVQVLATPLLMKPSAGPTHLPKRLKEAGNPDRRFPLGERFGILQSSKAKARHGGGVLTGGNDWEE